jgi:hypothetical protein
MRRFRHLTLIVEPISSENGAKSPGGCVVAFRDTSPPAATAPADDPVATSDVHVHARRSPPSSSTTRCASGTSPLRSRNSSRCAIPTTGVPSLISSPARLHHPPGRCKCRPARRLRGERDLALKSGEQVFDMRIRPCRTPGKLVEASSSPLSTSPSASAPRNNRSY